MNARGGLGAAGTVKSVLFELAAELVDVLSVTGTAAARVTLGWQSLMCFRQRVAFADTPFGLPQQQYLQETDLREPSAFTSTGT